jgi:hypothetical protein
MNEPAAHEFERRAAKAHDHEGNLVGYYFDVDLWREVRARLAAVEALADRWEEWASDYQPPFLPRNAARALRAAVAADPADTGR